MKYLINSIFFLLVILSCGTESPTTNETLEKKEMVPVVPKKTYHQLTVNINHLRVRDRAGDEGEVVGMLSEGAIVTYLNEKSSFKDAVTLRNIRYEEPWLKVAYEENKEGWIFAGGIGFDYENPPEGLSFLIENRIKSFLGTSLNTMLVAYEKAFRASKTSQALAENYEAAKALQKKINKVLENKPTVENPQNAPDLSWLEARLPGFATQLVAEGTVQYTFLDYKAWAKKARRTKGYEDDNFFKTCFAIYPIDSIEHFYPAWFLQTWDYGGHSELGKGIHHDILGRLNQLLATNNLFEVALNEFKDQVLNDITSEQNTYWLDKKPILAEIDKIIAADYGILTVDDKIALETRRKQFVDAEANGIKLNFREGVHDFQTLRRKG